MQFTWIFLTVIYAFSGAIKHETPLPAPDAVKKEYNWSVIADSVQTAFYQNYLSDNGHYIAQDNEGNQTFHYWWNAHVLDVLVDAHLRKGNQEEKMLNILRGIKRQNKGHYPNDYYDDMEWLALSSLRGYQATNNNEFLEAAEILWEDIKNGWNAEQGGGIAWRKTQLDYKNTPANAPAVILAARLFKENSNPEDLAWAKRIYQWQKANLVDPETGMVWDGVNRNGDQKVDKNWLFTYNHGVYIGAAVELFLVTKDNSYLKDAIKTADFVINSLELAPKGILKEEGSGDGGLFKGILVRYLAYMVKSTPLPEDRKNAYLKFLEFNAQTLYSNMKRPEMLIGPSWNKTSGAVIDSSVQLSGLMMLEAMATLHQE